MQYQVRCTAENCDHYLAAPHERQVERSAQEHTEETDHIVRVTGTYDSPTNGGFWQDGSPMRLSSEERHRLMQDLRARRQAPSQ